MNFHDVNGILLEWRFCLGLLLPSLSGVGANVFLLTFADRSAAIFLHKNPSSRFGPLDSICDTNIYEIGSWTKVRSDRPKMKSPLASFALLN